MLLRGLSTRDRTPDVLLTHVVVKVSSFGSILRVLLGSLIILLRTHILSLVHQSLSLLVNHVADLLPPGIELCLLETDDLVDLLCDKLKYLLSLGFGGRVDLHKER